MKFLKRHLSGKRLLNSSKWAFFSVMVYEGVETLLEYAIAYLVSSAITVLIIKALTTFAIVTATQVMSNQTQRFFLTFIKKFTYKKGDDKVKKLKLIWETLKANKLSLAVIVCAIISGLTGSQIIDLEKLPAINLNEQVVVEAVVQEEDLIAEETIWEVKPVYATEVVYGEPIFATEIVWEKEPVIADKVIYEEGKEPIYATETIYSVEPVIADKLTFIANTTIYEEDGETVKYNVGDIIPNNEISKYNDKVDVFNAGDILREGVILFEKGSIIKEGVIKFDVGDVVEEGIIKHNIGDYIGNEILYNIGDVVTEGIVKFNVGDVIIPAGTILEDAVVEKGTNITPILFSTFLMVGTILAGVFFEKASDYTKRKEDEKLVKEAKKELAAEETNAVNAEEQKIAEQKQKLADAEKAKADEEKRQKVEKIKAEIKAGNI